MNISNKKLAIIISILLVLIAIFTVILSNNDSQFTFSINEQTFEGPLANILGGVLGTIITTIVLFCVGIILIFVFSGVGMIVLSVLVLVGAILLVVALPFLLPVIVPLLLVYLFVVYTRKKKLDTQSTTNP